MGRQFCYALWAVFHVVGSESAVGSTYLHLASKKCKEWSLSSGGCARVPPSDPECPKHLDLLVEVKDRSENSAQRLVRLRSERLLLFIKYAREHLKKNRNFLITQRGVNIAGYFDKVVNWLQKRIKRRSTGKVRGSRRYELNRNPDVRFKALVRDTCRSTFKEGQELLVPSQTEKSNILSSGLIYKYLTGEAGNKLKDAIILRKSYYARKRSIEDVLSTAFPERKP